MVGVSRRAAWRYDYVDKSVSCVSVWLGCMELSCRPKVSMCTCQRLQRCKRAGSSAAPTAMLQRFEPTEPPVSPSASTILQVGVDSTAFVKDQESNKDIDGA